MKNSAVPQPSDSQVYTTVGQVVFSGENFFSYFTKCPFSQTQIETIVISKTFEIKQIRTDKNGYLLYWKLDGSITLR